MGDKYNGNTPKNLAVEILNTILRPKRLITRMILEPDKFVPQAKQEAQEPNTILKLVVYSSKNKQQQPSKEKETYNSENYLNHLLRDKNNGIKIPTKR